MFAAVQALRPTTSLESFCVRNVARPFAQGIYNEIEATGTIYVSEPTTYDQLQAADLAAERSYFMLHGADHDTSLFWGESAAGPPAAMSVSKVPNQYRGIVLTGCCWGALVASKTARQAAANELVSSRNPNSSIALRYLQAGALAFVGCTGSHYSPTVAPYNYFGGPLHRAFWEFVRDGRGPAEALLGAKLSFVRGMPHGRRMPFDVAVELKIFRQFTCLGIGW
jgi:hypothetical protein